MVHYLAKMLRPALAGILFPFATIAFLLMAGGYTTLAQAQSGQSASVSSQGASSSSGAPPATFDQWKAQNDANEKNSHSIQTFAIVAIVAVGGLALFRRYMRD